jgi:RNA-directed DNA polymerase
MAGARVPGRGTKIVYCKDANRRGSYEHTSFTFLGYEFRPRAENRNGQLFTAFSPAIGPDALKAKGRQVREWRIHKRVGSDLDELAGWINLVVPGWMNYYGRSSRSRLYRLLQRINACIMRWARNKYRRLGSFKKAKRWWTGLVDREPGLFAHWAWISTF